MQKKPHKHPCMHLHMHARVRTCAHVRACSCAHTHASRMVCVYVHASTCTPTQVCPFVTIPVLLQTLRAAFPTALCYCVLLSLQPCCVLLSLQPCGAAAVPAALLCAAVPAALLCAAAALQPCVLLLLSLQPCWKGRRALTPHVARGAAQDGRSLMSCAGCGSSRPLHGMHLLACAPRISEPN